MSSGSRGLLGEALGWVVLLAFSAAAVLHYEDIKALILERAIASAPVPAVEAAPRRSSNSSVELRISRDGHFHAAAEVNGRSIDVLVDTGASMVALTYDDARRAGILVQDSDFTQRVSTANGTGRVAPVTIDRISIGDITVRNVRAAVAEEGKLWKSLLGMAFIGRLNRAEMRSGTLVLEE